MATQETNCTYKNPKRPAFHESGHLVALYMLTGSLTVIKPNNGHSQGWDPSPVETHKDIFNEVCYFVAGGVAEMVYCHLKGLPLNTTMVEDLDEILTRARHHWKLPFKQRKNSYLRCPDVDGMIKAAAQVVTSQFQSYETILRVWSVTDYLIENNLVKTNVIEDLHNDTRMKRDLLKIFKTNIKRLEYELTNSKT